MAVRTDIHRPSLLDPAEYQFVSAFYQGSSLAMEKSYAREMADDYYPAVEAGPVFAGNYMHKNTCDHCGAVFAHGVLFRHGPTDELVHVGHICAADTVGLPSRAAASRRTAEKAAAAAKVDERAKERYAEWREQNGDVIEYLDRQAEAEVAYRDGHSRYAPHPFVNDMVHSFNRYGGLSDGQTNAVRKFMANEQRFAQARAEREAEDALHAPTTPLVEGRREVRGVIVSTKWQDGDYGSTPKMLVREADGNKVWGTVAESAFTLDMTLDALKGREVSFTASVTRSRDDEHFGFYKRPSKMTTKEQ